MKKLFFLISLFFFIQQLFAQCDTISNVDIDNDTYVIYTTVGGGYVSGNNEYGHKAMAEYFSQTQLSGMIKITGAYYFLGQATGTGENIKFSVWNETGGKPGIELGYKDIALSSIVSAYQTDPIFVDFDPDITLPISGGIFVGVNLPDTIGDTLALITNMDGETNPGTAWGKWSDDTWHAFSDIDYWNINFSFTIFPILCPWCYPSQSQQPICLVTVDSTSLKNLIVWEKTLVEPIASYNIYKETTVSGVYDSIGNVPYDSLSVFIDYSSNPAVKADRYKISIIDTSSCESQLSAAHKTIHLSVNLGIPPQINLIWDNYEGFTVNTFRIWRGNASGMNLIDSVAGTITSYTDLAPPANDTIYFIEALKPSGGCTPTIKSYSSTKSNFVNTKNPTGIIEHLTNTAFSIYPNPFNVSTTIYLKNDNQREQFYFILYDLCGRAVQTTEIKNETTILSRGNLKNGMYFYKIFNDSGILKTGKLILQ